MLVLTYGSQIFTFMVRFRFKHLGWLIFHTLAIPFFHLVLPVYSLWNMDDFSWGNTRLISNHHNKDGSLNKMNWDEDEEDDYHPITRSSSKYTQNSKKSKGHLQKVNNKQKVEVSRRTSIRRRGTKVCCRRVAIISSDSPVTYL